jgi:hypothetical protein
MTPMMDPDHPGYSDEGYRNPAFTGPDCGGPSMEERHTTGVSAALRAAPGAEAMMLNNPWFRQMHDGAVAAERAGRDALPLLCEAIVLLCQANVKAMKLAESALRISTSPRPIFWP